MDLTVDADPGAAAADWIARRLRDAVRRRGAASLALSGGATATGLIARLGSLPVPWTQVGCWQVDERVAPDGSPDRNAEQLRDLPCRRHLMPVTAADLRSAARRYQRRLPDRFDVVHLGLGTDGHTASWPPGAADILDSVRLVEVTGAFHGRRRMTLTPVVVNAARARVVLVVGWEKADVVERFVRRDPRLPADRIRRTHTSVFLDPGGASRLPM
jgi:6-phosphogluconolactonase/glucosamine-6-phosphate isomerase/deaminase